MITITGHRELLRHRLQRIAHGCFAVHLKFRVAAYDLPWRTVRSLPSPRNILGWILLLFRFVHHNWSMGISLTITCLRMNGITGLTTHPFLVGVQKTIQTPKDINIDVIYKRCTINSVVHVQQLCEGQKEILKHQRHFFSRSCNITLWKWKILSSDWKKIVRKIYEITKRSENFYVPGIVILPKYEHKTHFLPPR